jgi:hypothetical protein
MAESFSASLVAKPCPEQHEGMLRPIRRGARFLNFPDDQEIVILSPAMRDEGSQLMTYPDFRLEEPTNEERYFVVVSVCLGRIIHRESK